MKKMLSVAAVAALALSMAACQKEGETPATAPHPPGGPGSSIVMPVGDTQIIVPDEVKSKWSAVTLVVEDKASNKTSEVNVKLGGEHTIAGSNVKIKVGDFLPDFKMEGTVITSSSENMNNPAVKIEVFEGDAEIFKGWLYSKFPAIHPFQHEKYGLTLKDAVLAKK